VQGALFDVFDLHPVEDLSHERALAQSRRQAVCEGAQLLRGGLTRF
jgi:hypothetical protein